MTRTLMPASRIVRPPAAATSSAVPRSGCSKIRSAGVKTMSPMTRTCANVGGRRRSCMNHAHIIGTASFRPSDGWNVTKPRSSQRCAPLPICPSTATASSKPMPSRYIHGVKMRK